MSAQIGEKGIKNTVASSNSYSLNPQSVSALEQAHGNLPNTSLPLAETANELVGEWGFRNGLCELGDDNNVVILADKQDSPENWLPIMGNAILTSGLGNDSLSITSQYHSIAVRNSTIDTGGGSDTITLISGAAWLNDSPAPPSPVPRLSIDPAYYYEYLGREAGYGFGMVDSSLFAAGSGDSHISINARICGVMGAAAAGATSITTGDGNDVISIKADHRAVHNGSIYSGDGNDKVSLTSGYDTIVHGSAIHLGAGNDTLQIYGSNSTAWLEIYNNTQYMLDQSVVLTGTGDDRIEITHGYFVDGYPYEYLVNGSHFILGSGNDTLVIDTGLVGGMHGSEIILENYEEGVGNKSIFMESMQSGSLLDSSVISLGDGNDSIDLHQYFFKAWASQGATVINSHMATGAGDDTIRITTEEFESYNRYALYSSTITSGSGNDEIFISSNGGGIYDSSIDAGSGNDRIWLSSYGQSSYAAADSTISFGDGHDKLVMQGLVKNTTIATGNGWDHIDMLSSGHEDAWIHVGMVADSSIILGGGSDEIHINSDITAFIGSTITCDEADADYIQSKTISIESKAHALESSTIELGYGNDSLWLSSEAEYALDSSKIDTGSGNDYMQISGENAMVNSTILMGEGDDTLEIRGKTGLYSEIDFGDGNDMFILREGMFDSSCVLDGGTNRALDFSVGSLGDILSVSNESLHSFLGYRYNNQVSGFEALHIDLANGEGDSLVLESLLTSIADSSYNDGKFDSLVITGDASDFGALDIIKMGDARLNTGGMRVESFHHYDETFDWYTAYEGTDHQIEVYVATGMMIV